MDLSDEGEIKDDFSDISEEEYFDNIASKIEKRKLELELLNQFTAYDEYAKENRYENHRSNMQIPSTSRRNNNNNNGFRKEKPRKYNEVRHRNYRASSVFSQNYTIPKRKRQRKRRKYSKVQSPVLLSSDDESVVIKNDSDEDEELLALRLQALTSKQEVKELIDEPSTIDTNIQTNTFASSPVLMQNANNTNEDEEQLRIDALKSAIIKKKDHFKKRKQMKKLENERPYSPTDNFEPIVDVAMDLSNSPLGSPFHETLCDMNEEIDMDISNSPPQTEVNDLEDNRETCDMEIVCSPQPQKPADIESENEDELALRTMLLSSINSNNNSKKKLEDDDQKISENEQDMSAPSSPQSLIAKNLKIAVERIKQQKQQAQPIVSSQKSGTKTIKMILEEQKTKKLIKDNAPKKIQPIIEEESSKSFPENELNNNDSNLENGANNDENFKETLLIEKITTEQSLPCDDSILDKISLNIEPSDSSFSTITDTKNIPLLPATKKVDSRLVTSLDSIIRPVTPLVISLRADSSEDEYDIATKKNASRTSRAKPLNDFEKNLDNFLKNIRTQQESSQITKTVSSPILKTSKENNQSNISPKPSLSAVKHLPLSSQVEYEKLVRKMKILQEAKKQRQKAGTLKRTKSSSSTTEKSNNEASQSSVSNIKKQVPAKPVEIRKINPIESKEKNMSKIDSSINKIPLLDEAARNRLIEKTEISFLNHSKNLLESTEVNIKLLEENNLDFKRREKIESKISELEKTLVKYKNFLRIVNTRIKTNTPKIVQSQRDMIKLRNNQFRFGIICKRVGETVCGEDYKLPNYDETKIESNFLNISEKTEEIHKNLNEQLFSSKQLKILADKVKEFAPKSTEIQKNPSIEEAVKTHDTVNSQQILLDNKETSSERAIIRSVSQLIAACENEEEGNQVEVTDDTQQEKAPEFHRNVKRILECNDTSEFKKKVKYESPLEFLKLPSSIENSKSVNQIVCPFQMEGTCNDAQCEYLHL